MPVGLHQTYHQQRAKRTNHKMLDQHGRMWETTLDVTAKPEPGPCAPINPKGWTAPLIPPQEFIRFIPQEMMRCYIDYDLWIDRLVEANRDWETRLYAIALELSPNDSGVSYIGTAEKNYMDSKPALLRAAGVRPMAVELVIAAKMENPWILGLSDVPDPRLAKYLARPKMREYDFSPESYQEAITTSDPKPDASAFDLKLKPMNQVRPKKAPPAPVAEDESEVAVTLTD